MAGTACERGTRCGWDFIPHWTSLVPKLKPILADIEYLQDQHLLLTVKSMDGYESYGEEQEVPKGTRN